MLYSASPLYPGRIRDPALTQYLDIEIDISPLRLVRTSTSRLHTIHAVMRGVPS